MALFMKRVIARWIALSLLLLAGCVAHEPPSLEPEPHEIPPGHGVALVAVPFGQTASIASRIRLEVAGAGSCELRKSAVNRIYLPEGWYTFKLPDLPQDPQNRQLRHRIASGQISRFLVVLREPEDTADQRVALIAPSGRAAFVDLLQELELEVVDLELLSEP